MLNYIGKQAQHLRKEYPRGTRLCVIEMNDPYSPVPPGTVGTVAYIDDAGQIHMHWDNGRALALIPSVDSFAMVSKGRFSTPLQVMFCRGHYDDFEELDPKDVLDYAHDIENAIANSVGELDEHRGLAEYIDDEDLEKKVYSIFPSVEVQGNKLVGIITCELKACLTDKEEALLRDEIEGQLSDGWGEGFSQRDIKVDDGEVEVFFWSTSKDNTLTKI